MNFTFRIYQLINLKVWNKIYKKIYKKKLGAKFAINEVKSEIMFLKPRRNTDEK